MSPDCFIDTISLSYLYPQNVFHLNFNASSKSLNMDNRYCFKNQKHTVKDLAHVYINESACFMSQ